MGIAHQTSSRMRQRPPGARLTGSTHRSDDDSPDSSSPRSPGPPRWRSWLQPLRARIGTRLILGAGLVNALVIGLMATVTVRAHEDDLIRELNRSADQLGETVQSSTYHDMLENRRERLHQQIVAIGNRKGIEKVRLFNKDGAIMFSSDSEEIGKAVDKRAEACTACHAIDRPLERLPISRRSRIYVGSDGNRVLGIIKPIQNQPSCSNAACHAHAPGQRILGVLDIDVTLAEVDEGIHQSKVRMAVLAAMAIFFSSLILWWLNRILIVKPVRALAAGTRRVADGDLTTLLPATADHELGDLARAFNEMTKRLSEAQRMIAQSNKLASVGRLAAGVAHEINNPLTGVLTYASFLAKRAEEGSEMQADLDVIVRETKRCREIVKGLLEFARPSPPRRQSTDLNEVVLKAVTIVMNQLSLKRVAPTLELDPELPAALADPNQLQQVIVNLLLNAADSIEGGGPIRISSHSRVLPAYGFRRIRQARCPGGCDLMDTTTRISGKPSIRVLLTSDDHEGVLLLDSMYGHFGHRASHSFEEGMAATVSCPRCRASLMDDVERCEECGSPAFAVQVPGHGEALWCSRVGCHWAHWPEVEADGDIPIVEVEVADQGKGIAEADLAHIFDPFFTTKGTHGTGLGLAVSWGIIDAHGGTIDVESEEGHGSQFTVRLPLEAGSPSSEGRSGPRSWSGRGKGHD